MANYVVTTSIGPAILRQPRPDADRGFDPRMVPEAAALTYAHGRGVRVPRLLHADNAGRYLIEELLSGSEPSPDNWLTWLPKLLDEVTRLQSGVPATRPGLQSVYDWQQWMASFLDKVYTDVQPAHRARMSKLGVPRLSDHWRPSEDHASRPLTVVHSDLHPKNLLIDHGDLWILDWELTLVADPIWEAAVALHRTSWPSDQAKAQAREMWLAELAMHGLDADIMDTLLAEYSTVEVWRSLITDSWRYPQMVAANPERTADLADAFHRKVAAGTHAFGCADLNHDETSDLLQRWADEEELRQLG